MPPVSLEQRKGISPETVLVLAEFPSLQFALLEEIVSSEVTQVGVEEVSGEPR